MCMYVHHLHTWCPKKTKSPLDPLELEVGMAVNHHVGARNQTLSSASTLIYWLISPALKNVILKNHKLEMVVHAFASNTWVAETERSLSLKLA